ncbi:glycosyltransferase family 2 protein [Amylibacter sp. SFDW26]|uniref:glycosyltransferase family 2 protein n=1 Tax=Amylibacter sp. SFDW26 TaxID=2652722 RepID=UPI0012618FA2|nr:glycosyltransferase family 2 protein [Amylibacter sp. SFDW26]KAB7614406.1 glycosyltransferase family 2 protein [Amylibacter sp. SFDW26]
MTYNPDISPLGSQIKNPILSIIVPMYNEEQNVDRLLEHVIPVVEDIEPNYEIILVDDGSRDNTAEKVIEYCEVNAKLKFLAFSRNFGKEAALNAGLSYASGQAIIQIDADLQHPPEVIRTFYQEWKSGAEIVYGQRTSRDDDSALRGFLTRSFYKIFATVSDVKLMNGLGDFLLMDRKVVDALLSLPERERFTKGLYAWVGFKRVAVPFDVAPREHGQSAWSILRLYLFALGAITSFSTIPLKIWTYVGLFLAIPSFAYGGYIMIKTMILGIDVPGYASLMVAVCFFSGIQLLGLGIIGDYLGRVLKEVKQRPLYLISAKYGFDQAKTMRSETAKIKKLPC